MWCVILSFLLLLGFLLHPVLVLLLLFLCLVLPRYLTFSYHLRCCLIPLSLVLVVCVFAFLLLPVLRPPSPLLSPIAPFAFLQ